MINAKGETMIPLKYCRAPELVGESDLLFYKEKGRKFYQGILNQKGEEIVPFKYTFAQYRNDGHYVGISENGRYDFYDASGEKIYEANSRSVQFIDSLYIIERSENEAKINILKTGKQTTHKSLQVFNRYIFGLDSTETTVYFPEGRIVSRKGNWRLSELRNELFLVSEIRDGHSYFGLWNMDAKDVLGAQHSQILGWSKKWAVVRTARHRGKSVLIDLDSQKEVGVYDKVELLACDNLRLYENGVDRIVNDQLKELSETDLNKKTAYYNLSEGDLTQVRRKYTHETKRDFDEVFEEDADCGGRDFRDLNIRSIRLIQDRYGRNPLPNRLAVNIYEGNTFKMGLLTFEGREIVPFERGSIGLHWDGLIEFGEFEKLDVGGKVRIGLMDRNGVIVLPARYDDIEDVRGDTAIVVLHGIFSMINFRTDEVILSAYRHIRYVNDFISIQNNGKYGAADFNGKVIIPAIYDKVYLGSERLFEVERDKKKYYIDKNGQEIERE